MTIKALPPLKPLNIKAAINTVTNVVKSIPKPPPPKPIVPPPKPIVPASKPSTLLAAAPVAAVATVVAAPIAVSSVNQSPDSTSSVDQSKNSPPSSVAAESPPEDTSKNTSASSTLNDKFTIFFENLKSYPMYQQVLIYASIAIGGLILMFLIYLAFKKFRGSE